MVYCELEGVAGYVKNEQKTRCQQENGRWQEVIFLYNEWHHNVLMPDLGLTLQTMALVAVVCKVFASIETNQ